MNFEGRKFFIIFFIVATSVIYSVKLLHMQVIDNTWSERAAFISETRREIIPPRGVMFDRNGIKVVANSPYYDLRFIEKNIVDLDTHALAELLQVHDTFIRFRFDEIVDQQGVYKGKSNYQKAREYTFVQGITKEEIARIAPELYRFPGFYEVSTSMRNYLYPNAANILGYTAEVDKEKVDNDPYYRSGDFIGKAGLERFYEEELRGQKGIKYLLRNSSNNTIQSFEEGRMDTVAIQGQNLTLGVDIELQAYGELLMKNKLGCIVAIEPATGELLALVSSPSYDPNLLVGRQNISANYPKLLLDPHMPLFPRPTQAEYPPGSIFKLVQALIAMQEGVITENTGFPCTSSIVGCHSHAPATNVSKAVQYSCNPYFYYTTKKIIEQGKKKSIFEDAALGLAIWEKYMHSFGLGVRLETDTYGIRPGLIPNPAFYDRWYGKNGWAFKTIRSIAIGQGEVKLTPLQMANIAAIIANRGWYITPHCVKSIGGNGPRPEYLVKNKTMVDSIYFIPVIEGMRRVTEEAGGTGRNAKVPDVTVCGKTGTVENPHGKDHSVFIAFAPMDNPKIAIAVFTENAGFGGTWSAPITSLMIEFYLKREISDKAKEQRILDAVILPTPKIP
jgi:penicillin-binding protein 2